MSRKRPYPLTVDGVTLYLTEWASNTGQPYRRLYDRIHAGYSDHEVVHGRKATRCDSVRLTVNGVSKTIPQWANETGTPLRTLYSRKSAGWPDIDVVQGRHK